MIHLIKGAFAALLLSTNAAQAQAPTTHGPPASQSQSSMYAAVAIHPKASDVWAITNISHEQEAHRLVLEYCAELMGEKGCEVTTSVRNASIAVVRVNTGALLTGWGETPKTAMQKMMARCTAASLRCTAFKSFTATPVNAVERVPAADLRKVYLPDSTIMETVYSVYSSAAWMEKSNGSVTGGTVWVSGGQNSSEGAQKSAIDACEAATKVKCVTSITVANGFIAVGRSDENNIVTSVDQSAADVQKTMAAQCKARKQKCKRIGVIDAKQRGIQTIETRAAQNSK